MDLDRKLKEIFNKLINFNIIITKSKISSIHFPIHINLSIVNQTFILIANFFTKNLIQCKL
jgi:hypothetical protein